MADTRKYNVPFRRKRTGKTDFKQRLSLLKSRKPRLVVRKSLQGVVTQLVEYTPDGDKVITTVRTSDLKKYGLTVLNGNVPTAYLTGLLLGKKALAKGVSEAIVDAGLQKLTDQSRIFAVVKGAVDAGLDVHSSDSHFPSEERLTGVHIEKFAQAVADNADVYNRQFSGYIAAKIDPKAISKTFATVKAKIVG